MSSCACSHHCTSRGGEGGSCAVATASAGGGGWGVGGPAERPCSQHYVGRMGEGGRGVAVQSTLHQLWLAGGGGGAWGGACSQHCI